MRAGTGKLRGFRFLLKKKTKILINFIDKVRYDKVVVVRIEMLVRDGRSQN